MTFQELKDRVKERELMHVELIAVPWTLNWSNEKRMVMGGYAVWCKTYKTGKNLELIVDEPQRIYYPVTESIVLIQLQLTFCDHGEFGMVKSRYVFPTGQYRDTTGHSSLMLQNLLGEVSPFSSPTLKK